MKAAHAILATAIGAGVGYLWWSIRTKFSNAAETSGVFTTPIQQVTATHIRPEPSASGGDLRPETTIRDIAPDGIETVGEAITAANTATGFILGDIGKDIKDRANEIGDAIRRRFAPSVLDETDDARAAAARRIYPPAPAANRPRLSAPGFVDFTADFTEEYDDLIIESAARQNQNAALLKQLLIAESSLNPDAQNEGSSAGGIAQFVDATWNEIAPGQDKFNPEHAIPKAAEYLQWIKNYTGAKNNYDLVVAYHWGAGNVKRHGAAAAPDDITRYAAKITARAGVS